jgi:hypothetical protein
MADFNLEDYEGTFEKCCVSCEDENCGSVADVLSAAVGELRRSTCNCGCDVAVQRRQVETSEQAIYDLHQGHSSE